MVEKPIAQSAEHIKRIPIESAGIQPVGVSAPGMLFRPCRRAAMMARAAALAVKNTSLETAKVVIRLAERIHVALSEHTTHNGLPRSAGALVLFAFVAVIFATAFIGVGLEVSVGGEPVGHVRDREQFNEVIEGVEAKASAILGYPYTVNTDVTYQLDIFARRGSQDMNMAEVERALFADIDEIAQLYVLTVDGNVIGANADGGALLAMIDEPVALASRTTRDAESVELMQDVAVTLQYTAASNEKSLEEIADIIHSNSIERMTYIVQAGDVFGDIAARNGMSEEMLLELNPDVDPDAIAAGDTLSVGEAVPFMSVKVTRTEQTTETFEHNTEYVYSKNYWEGDSFVTTRGVDGEKLITCEVVYVNGKETERTVINEEITVEPVTEVITLGTRSFIVPFPGYRQISSTFGWRTYALGTDRHTGIDFAGPSGSRVVASYSGRVTWSGSNGRGYGKFIKIDHGGGYETLYAHNSKLLVKVGDYVEQGQTIAYVGSTGKSTGPHCHFEIRINGEAVNPWRYLFK